jgi:type III restriction enzyme
MTRSERKTKDISDHSRFELLLIANKKQKSRQLSQMPRLAPSWTHQKYILVFRLVELLGDLGEQLSQVVIENPIINSPFDEPTRHFRFDDEGITDQEVVGRRVSHYFVPIARPRKKNGAAEQGIFDTEWTQDRIEVNKLVNDIRRRVAIWRKGGFVGVTPTTARLISYWTDPSREKRLFFCQNEALQTAIYIVEVAKKYGDAWIENALREANDTSNPGLPRMAFKMATGAGKTVVMAMLIAWHTLNKHANPQDARFSDTFLIVTPGITIRDRLRVLLPNDPENYYRHRDIVSAQQKEELGRAKILITNFHAFQLREKVPASKITKSILVNGEASPFIETPDQIGASRLSRIRHQEEYHRSQR